MRFRSEMASPAARWVAGATAVVGLLASLAPTAFGQAEPTATPAPSVTTTAAPSVTQTAAPSGTPTLSATTIATTTPVASPTLSASPAPTSASAGPASTSATAGQSAPAVPHDDRFFADTGFRVDNDAIWSYFQARGRVETFGLPVSRTFGFLGCQTQIFQRQVAQLCSGQQVQLANLLDPDIFPYTKVNNSTFPPADDTLKSSTPRVGDANYGSAIISFVRTTAPDTFDNSPVGFGHLFFNSITPAQANVTNPDILNLIQLEVWGAPISKPLRDPNNSNFVYQRFQRGIMHFDASSGATHGILLADYLKQVLLGPRLAGANLPADLAAQAEGSRMFNQYCPGAFDWLCRPSDLPGTDLTFAFERDTTAGSTATAAATATPSPNAVASPSPAATTASTPAATTTPAGTLAATTTPAGTGTPLATTTALPPTATTTPLLGP